MELTDEEADLLATLIRDSYRRQHKKIRDLIKKFGDDADTEYAHVRIEMLRSIYRKIGRDPDRITNVVGERDEQ